MVSDEQPEPGGVEERGRQAEPLEIQDAGKPLPVDQEVDTLRRHHVPAAATHVDRRGEDGLDDRSGRVGRCTPRRLERLVGLPGDHIIVRGKRV